MAEAETVLHPEFRPEPFWWESFRPVALDAAQLPRRIDVAIVGGGYTGLSAAKILHDSGLSVAVLEANLFGSGASTRSGGAVSAGVHIGKSFAGRVGSLSDQTLREIRGWSSAAYDFLLELIAGEGIDCELELTGRFLGALSPGQFEGLRQRHERLTASGIRDCTLVPRGEQDEEIGSDIYWGGMIYRRASKLHPALLYRGFLARCQGREHLHLLDRTPVTAFERRGTGWSLTTPHGELESTHVIVATNGYTTKPLEAFGRCLLPVASHIVATEPLPADLARSLIPTGRTVSETLRIPHYFRLSPDGRRLLFGGRTRFTPTSVHTAARLLQRQIVKRFPQLEGVRLTHCWQGNVAFTRDALPHLGEQQGLHYVLGCNGSGVAMMPYLGAAVARKILRDDGMGKEPFEAYPLRPFPLNTGRPWFMPLVGSYLRLLDGFEEGATKLRGGNGRAS